MPPKPRRMEIQSKGAMAAMARLETLSDDELEAETKFKSAALMILGARASERYDAKAARGYFQRAIAAARPQERMQLRRMADASLALAERRAGDLKEAVQKLGHEAPSGRQLLALRFMGLIAPPASAGTLARVRGIVVLLLLVALIVAVATGIVQLLALPFGGVSTGPSVFYGLLLVTVALVVLLVAGRRRQRAITARRQSGGSG